MRIELDHLLKLIQQNERLAEYRHNHMKDMQKRIATWQEYQKVDYSPTRESFIKSEQRQLDLNKEINADELVVLQVLKEKYITLGGKL